MARFLRWYRGEPDLSGSAARVEAAVGSREDTAAGKVSGTGVSPEGVAEVGRASGGTGAGDTRPGMGGGITGTL